MIQNNLNIIKSKLKTLDTINSEIKTIEKSTGKITDYCREIRNEVTDCADKIMVEIRKQYSIAKFEIDSQTYFISIVHIFSSVVLGGFLLFELSLFREESISS